MAYATFITFMWICGLLAFLTLWLLAGAVVLRRSHIVWWQWPLCIPMFVAIGLMMIVVCAISASCASCYYEEMERKDDITNAH